MCNKDNRKTRAILHLGVSFCFVKIRYEEDCGTLHTIVGFSVVIIYIKENNLWWKKEKDLVFVVEYPTCFFRACVIFIVAKPIKQLKYMHTYGTAVGSQL